MGELSRGDDPSALRAAASSRSNVAIAIARRVMYFCLALAVELADGDEGKAVGCGRKRHASTAD